MSDYTPLVLKAKERQMKAEHAAELRKARAAAVRDAANALSRQPSTCKSPGCHRADQIILESLADQIEEDQCPSK